MLTAGPWLIFTAWFTGTAGLCAVAAYIADHLAGKDNNA